MESLAIFEFFVVWRRIFDFLWLEWVGLGRKSVVHLWNWTTDGTDFTDSGWDGKGRNMGAKI
jgi:hypothetical protein